MAADTSADTDERLWGPRDDERAQRLADAMLRSDLESALFAIDGASPGEVVRAQSALDAWADRVRGAASDARRRDGAPGVRRASECSAALRAVLVDHAGLTGDCQNYYAACNSRLTEVIARRRGQPILLASVWMLVAGRAGLQVDGVGMPGHFIVRVGDPRHGVLKDPFNNGRRLTVRDCADIVQRLSGGSLPWEDAYLEPTPVADLTTRVLRNLMRASQLAGDPCGLYRAVRLLSATRPDDAEAALLHARAAEEVGATRLARRLYGDVAERWPGTCEAAVAARRAVAVGRKLSTLH